MSLRETLSYDPVTKIKTVFESSTDGNEYTIATLQDVTDIVETNKLFYNSVDERARYGEKMQRMASLPVSIYYDLLLKGIVEPGDPNSKKLLKYLDDIDNLSWRTRPGRLSR